MVAKGGELHFKKHSQVSKPQLDALDPSVGKHIFSLKKGLFLF